MRRIATVMGLMVVLIVLVAGVALAVEYKVKQCNSDPCKGTNGSDLMYERQGQVRDRIYGYDSKDRLVASTFSNDEDKLYGGRGNDVLFTNDNDGRDLANGGRGRDRCVADPGDRVSSCRRVDPQSSEGQRLLKGTSAPASASSESQ